MNLPFCNWLCNYAKHDPLWTMFHEVAFISRDNWKQHIVATVTQMMARRIAKASERNFVSTIAWIPLMRSIGIEGREPKWLPIPSSIPINNDSRMVTAIRDALGINSNPERRIVGHFGTFGGLVWSVLQPVLARILRDLPNIIIQLIGRGSQSARAKLGHYDDMSRVVAADDLGAVEVASRIQSCDLMVQPFTDGVNLRRTSVLSSMKLNTAIVSNVGHNTEPVWSNERLVGLTSSLDPTEMFTLVKQLLNDEEARMSYARRAHSYYHRTCEMEAIVKILKEEIT